MQNTFEQNIIYADPELFDTLDFPIIAGRVKNNFGEPSTIIITEVIAEKYFPKESPVGKTFILDNITDYPCKICAVVKNNKSTSHIQFDFMLPATELRMTGSASWMNSNFYTYVLLKEGTTDQGNRDSHSTRCLSSECGLVTVQ